MILRNYKQYFRNYKRYFVLVFLLFFSCSNTGVGNSYNVLEVYDGDTITIEHPKVKRLRYLGIDAPEKLTNYSPGEPFHLKSTDLNKELVGGKLITIEFDREKYDHYGRLIGYVLADGIFDNEEIESSLNLVFFKNDFGNFRCFGIEPSKFYLERYVEVIGRIKMYRGSPQITVEHPISIRVLD